MSDLIPVSDDTFEFLQIQRAPAQVLEEAKLAAVAIRDVIAKKPKPRRTAVDVTELSPWQKICPRCRVVTHVRKQACPCGYKFPTARRVAPK